MRLPTWHLLLEYAPSWMLHFSVEWSVTFGNMVYTSTFCVCSTHTYGHWCSDFSSLLLARNWLKPTHGCWTSWQAH